MRQTDLHTDAARLRDALKDLQIAWNDVGEHWNDRVSEKFREDHLDPLGPVLKQSLDAVSRMSQLTDQIRRDCDE